MTDALIKKGASKAECPTPENPTFVIPKPLSEAKVALVTSASLHHEDDDDLHPAILATGCSIKIAATSLLVTGAQISTHLA